MNIAIVIGIGSAQCVAGGGCAGPSSRRRRRLMIAIGLSRRIIAPRIIVVTAAVHSFCVEQIG